MENRFKGKKYKCSHCGKFVSHEDLNNDDALYEGDHPPEPMGWDGKAHILCKKCYIWIYEGSEN